MNEELNKALDQISDNHIDEAATRQRKGFPWIRSIAAVLALVIACTAVWAAFGGTKPIIPTESSISTDSKPEYPSNLGGIQSPSTLQLSNLVAGPAYPKMAPCPNYDDYTDYKDFSAALDLWNISRHTQYDQPVGYADNLNEFWQRSIAQFLSGEGNRAYSPANVYMAMAMLAETTGGNSRQQILDLLGADSIEALRTQAGHVWNAQYCDDGQSTSLLANSLWLDDSYTFKYSAVQNLVNHYYASIFSGNLSSKEMSQQLQAWLNSQTGGLLQEQVKNQEFSEYAVFALASTIYFTAGWNEEFNSTQTADATFHCKDGNLTTAFMNKTIISGTYYWGSNFGAVRLKLTKGYMWLILPDEGYTVEDILKEDEYLSMALAPNRWKNQKKIILNLSLPKFDISSQADLIDGMKALGLSDIFNEHKSDFTPITDADELVVDKIDHAVRVAIDEDGVVASAYTIIDMADGGMPPENEIDFVLDRPFLFLVTDDVPLFAGVVEQP